MAKAEIKGGRRWEHQPTAHWGASVVQPHKKGEAGSDLPFKMKCVMNKCIVEFFFPRLLIPDHFPLPALGMGNRAEEGRCLKPLFLTNLLYHETKLCSSPFPAVWVWCLQFCVCKQCRVHWSELPASVPLHRSCPIRLQGCGGAQVLSREEF